MSATAKSTGLSITNPLVLYRALVATKRVDPDPAQHRLAIHLQQVHERLRDYEPIVQYGYRLQQLGRALGSTPARPLPGSGHEIPPATNTRGVFSSLFEKREQRGGLALTRVLTNNEAAMEMDSPRGLMLHGEVGTGKSMLIDLFAECLPNRKKRRLHYSTFMLDTLGKLEQLHRSRQLIIPTSLGQENDYSLLWLARDMISTSPILFLDEFQLPDRAAAKIVTNLMTCFFHLGGVLIATSNRMPEDLAKAAGAEFAPPPSERDTLAWRFMRKSGFGDASNTKYPKQSDFAAFLDVLKARCEVWEMESKRDYRRRENNRSAAKEQHDRAAPSESDTSAFHGLQPMKPGNIGLGYGQSRPAESAADNDNSSTASTPQNYHICPPPSADSSSTQAFHSNLHTTIQRALNLPPNLLAPIPWTPSTLHVYRRTIPVPRQHSGAASFTFPQLCQAPLGPADFITLASTYHTLILTSIPVLSLLHKNEARRLITLLDALYEAKCKLLVTADAGPDSLFFPEHKNDRDNSTAASEHENEQAMDPTLPETYAEIYQDSTAPFRPNVAAYDPSVPSPQDTGVVHARGAPNPHPPDQLEDTPPNTLSPRRGSAASGLGDPAETPEATAGTPDFRRQGVFTGEDERFAYKRAASRLWEMCGVEWWARRDEGEGNGEREGPSWWRPVPLDVRWWEYGDEGGGASSSEGTQDPAVMEGKGEVGGVRPNARGDEGGFGKDMFRYGGSPFRASKDPPPSFEWPHFWGLMRWGRKAGRWGRGVEGLRDRGGRENGSEGLRDRGGDGKERVGFGDSEQVCGVRSDERRKTGSS